MDPLTLAGSFATVVGLLANYKAERSGATLDEFMEWMREHHQDALATSIDQNQRLRQALSLVLATNHDELVVRLHLITAQLSEIAGRVEGFRELASVMGNPSSLSPQAMSVLRQIANSSAKFVMQQKAYGGTRYLLMDGGTGDIEVPEPRYIDEDFEALASAGYLRVEFTSKGTPKYKITRAGTNAATDA
jgi:predicted NBD/HSP70 family sugar kinase